MNNAQPEYSEGANRSDALVFTPVVASLSALMVTGCGGGGAAGTNATSTSPPIVPPQPAIKLAPADDQQAARFLQQAQFSSTLGEIATLRQGTYEDWMQKQFSLPRDQSGWDWLRQRGYNANYDGVPTEFHTEAVMADFMMWSQLFSGQEQMRKRFALALSEFFVISIEAMTLNWPSQIGATWWDLLATHAFGNFRTLLEEVTLNNAMGDYLNTRGNQKANPTTGRVPDENYAREIMQLFTIGLYNLKDDGTFLNDPPVESYTQTHITNLARVFTGYDVDKSRRTLAWGPLARGLYDIPVVEYTQSKMVLNTSLHSMNDGDFVFFTESINGGDSAATKLRKALDALFNHKNTAPFFCKQMIQRLVTSNPSAEYVGRVASKFIDNGAGARGDLKAVWVAILTDPEARWTTTPPSGHGKLREPLLRFIQWGRSFKFSSGSGGWKMHHTKDPADGLGQSPLRSPSVFNFFRPGFVPPGLTNTAPEFQIVNETSVAGYLNYMHKTLGGPVYVGAPAAAAFPFYGSTFVPDLEPVYDDELLAIATDTEKLVNRMSVILCADRLSVSTKTTMINGIKNMPISTRDNKIDRIRAATLMALSCAEYLIQK